MVIWQSDGIETAIKGTHLRGLLEATGAAEERDHLGDGAELRGVLEEHLLEVIDGRLPLRLLDHDVGDHHARAVRVGVHRHQRRALLLCRLDVAARELQARDAEHGLLVVLVMAERLSVRLERRVGVVQLLVQGAELHGHVRRDLLLGAEVGRAALLPQLRDGARLVATRVVERLECLGQRAARRVHLREEHE